MIYKNQIINPKCPKVYDLDFNLNTPQKCSKFVLQPKNDENYLQKNQVEFGSSLHLKYDLSNPLQGVIRIKNAGFWMADQNWGLDFI